MTDVLRYRLDDLRRFASALAVGVGVPPARASALASHLLWFDAAGASHLGIATLPDTLARIESGAIDPKTDGAVVSERSSTTDLDGRRGVPLLILERAGGLATEKARDTGVGLVRVGNVGPHPSAAGVAADMAIGPVAATVLGPGPSWAVALPGEGGLPAVFDPALAVAAEGDAAAKPSRGKGSATLPPSPRRAIEAMVGPWAAVLAPGDGWLVAAVSVSAMEPLPTFQARVADATRGLDEAGGRLLPGPWEARRREARERGVAISPAALKALEAAAQRAGVEPPAPSQEPA